MTLSLPSQCFVSCPTPKQALPLFFGDGLSQYLFLSLSTAFKGQELHSLQEPHPPSTEKHRSYHTQEQIFLGGPVPPV